MRSSKCGRAHLLDRQREPAGCRPLGREDLGRLGVAAAEAALRRLGATDSLKPRLGGCAVLPDPGVGLPPALPALAPVRCQLGGLSRIVCRIDVGRPLLLAGRCVGPRLIKSTDGDCELIATKSEELRGWRLGHLLGQRPSEEQLRHHFVVRSNVAEGWVGVWFA